MTDKYTLTNEGDNQRTINRLKMKTTIPYFDLRNFPSAFCATEIDDVSGKSYYMLPRWLTNLNYVACIIK